MSGSTNITALRLKVAFSNLVVVAIIGGLLRYFFFRPFSGFNYSYTLHAHSHLAFLGWVFMALYALITQAYLPRKAASKKYSWLFYLLQLANLGMLFTFPFMGYALWSIVFSTLHALTAMVFVWIFIREAGRGLNDKHKRSFIFVKWGLVLMFISNLAPFALGPVSVIQGKGDLYYLLIYFYLHFQYNGWFTFALLGLLLWQLERLGVSTDHQLVRVGFRLKLFAVFPAYLLSALWATPDTLWYVIGGLAGFTQFVGLILLITFVFRHIQTLFLQQSTISKVLFYAGALAISLQHILMLLSAIPDLARLAFTRNVVIAYLHMVLLGFVSCSVFYLVERAGYFKSTLILKSSMLLFLGAFIITEFILIFQSHLSNSQMWLFALAVAQLAGLTTIAFQLKGQKTFLV